MGSEVTRACVGDPSGGWDLTGVVVGGVGGACAEGSQSLVQLLEVATEAGGWGVR